MKKTLLLMLSLALLTVSCVSCNISDKEDVENENTEVTSNVTDDTQNDNEDYNSEATDSTEKEDIVKDDEGAKESDTQAEVQGDTYSHIAENGFEIAGELGSSEFAIYTIDGERYGICGIDGKTIVAPEFNLIGWCPWHEVVYAEPFAEGREPIVISDKYKIDVHYGHGGSGKGFYIYDCNTEKMYLASSDIEVFYMQELETVPADTPYICYDGDIALYEGEVYPGADKEELYYTMENLAFGSAEYEYMTSRGSIVKLGECEIADGFTNDYMMIRRNGKVGFVDLAGNEACEFVYTDALRAFDNKAWAKTEEGIWKVVNLK